MASKKVLPKLKKGALSKYGLHNLEDMTIENRMKGYEKAIKVEGYAPLVARLNVLAIYTKNSNPSFHKLIKNDMKRIKRKLAPIYSKTMKVKENKEVKAGNYKTRDGKKRQLYRLQNSKAKYYKYKGVDGKMKKRYI
jgi:hypothetical protein